MSLQLTGIHHLTAITANAPGNLHFYTKVLGLRLVKKTVNQDDTSAYHLFYADGEGHPGTDITFFPWPDMPAAKAGTGLSMEISLAVPVGSIDFWADRLHEQQMVTGEVETRRGGRALGFNDPHGLRLTLHETADDREFSPWKDSPVPAEKQIRGLHSVRLWERDLGLTS